MRFSIHSPRAVVVLVPLLAAATWGVVYESSRRIEDFVWPNCSFRLVLGLRDYPDLDPPPVDSIGDLLSKTLVYAWPILPCAAVIVLAVCLGTSTLIRPRALVRRRVRDLPLKAGAIALLISVAASALLAASHLVVLHELGYYRHWVSSDRIGTPWACLSVLTTGLLLALSGAFATWALTHIDRRRRISTTKSLGEPS